MPKTIVDYIYSENSLEDILNKYILNLQKRNTVTDMQHATGLTEYQNIRLDSKLPQEMSTLTIDLFQFISAKYPESKYEVQFRIKSLLDANKKIVRNILLKTSVDIKDNLGIRIISFCPNTVQDILKLHEMIFDIIEYIIAKGYILCLAESPIDTENFNKLNFPGIVTICEDDLQTLPRYSKYKYGLKNYILEPKSTTGYQSVHVVFKSPKTNIPFEIQFRLLFMHKCSFEHDEYKKNKYRNIALNIDYTKIHTPNFFINKEHEILDYDGIVYPINKIILNNL